MSRSVAAWTSRVGRRPQLAALREADELVAFGVPVEVRVALEVGVGDGGRRATGGSAVGAPARPLQGRPRGCSTRRSGRRCRQHRVSASCRRSRRSRQRPAARWRCAPRRARARCPRPRSGAARSRRARRTSRCARATPGSASTSPSRNGAPSRLLGQSSRAPRSITWRMTGKLAYRFGPTYTLLDTISTRCLHIVRTATGW